MTRIDPEELLWELSSTESDEDGGESPSDGTLAAYRAGELPAGDAERVERLLAHSSAARARLRELAEIAPPAPPPSLRRRVLGGAAPRPWVGPLAAAAVLAIALGLGGHFLGGGRPDDLPDDLAFEVSLDLLADVRAGSAPEEMGIAYADTPVRIVIEPVETAMAGLEFGLYRRRHGQVERLAPAAGIALELGRGTAVFTAPAARLVGDEPGPKELLIAVARAGRLPAALTPATDEDAAVLLEVTSGGRVYRRTIILLAEPGKDGPAN